MIILYTQVHCLHDDQVLLLKRHKEPNMGLWVAPGGKIEALESPYEGAVRELAEETGLVVQAMRLRGIVRTVAPANAHFAIRFLCAVTEFTGTLAADEREGHLRWWPVDEAIKRWAKLPRCGGGCLPSAGSGQARKTRSLQRQ